MSTFSDCQRLVFGAKSTETQETKANNNNFALDN